MELRAGTVASIRAERLDLVSMSPELIGALLEGDRGEAETLLGARVPPGWPDAHDAGFLRMRGDEMRRDPETRQWLVRGIVPREIRELVGHAGFHGPPGANALGKTDAVELGYTVFPPFRGRGYATEATRALMSWARRTHGIRTFVAAVAPTNRASLAVVRRLGFVRVGERMDEVDGLELVFALEVSPA